MRPLVGILTIALATAVTATPDASAVGGSTGIFADPLGTDCNIVVPSGAATPVYLVCRLDGIDGISGCGLRVAGLPETLIPVSESYSRCAEVPRDLFGSGAVLSPLSLASPCQQGTVVGVRFLIAALSDARDVRLTIGAVEPPPGPSLACPFVLLCDSPTYAAVCVEGVTTYVNASPCTTRVGQYRALMMTMETTD